MKPDITTMTQYLTRCGIEHRVSEVGIRRTVLVKENVVFREGDVQREHIAWASWNPLTISADLEIKLIEVLTKPKHKGGEYGYEVCYGKSVYIDDYFTGKNRALAKAPTFFEAWLKLMESWEK